MELKTYEVIIIGGGPAGLNAALILGRCGRKTVLFDSKNYRNKKAQGIHGFISRDGIPPNEFIHLARLELNYYEVEIVEDEISEGKTIKGGFEVIDSHGRKYQSKKMLLATGLKDIVPSIEGFDSCYGISVFHCPYCDGWENKNSKIAVYGKSKGAFELALTLYNWSTDVILLTDGINFMNERSKKDIKAHGIKVIDKPVKKLKHNEGRLSEVVFEDNTAIDREILFFSTGFDQRSILGTKLGCKYTDKGVIINDKYQHSNIPGLFVAGDAAQDMQFVIVAAAEGAKAAVTINKELTKERIRQFRKNIK
jgi:thioredoxin reductase